MSGDSLFPENRPRCARRIAVGDGHILHVEECGAPDGLPVLFLHGGPGSGCSPMQRRLFDPQRYRAILVDQRGAGRSMPLGELADNTTVDLVADLETVREALGIGAWIVFGGSWGSLLALAYAELFPERVLGLVLRGIFLGSPEEIAAYADAAALAWPERPPGDALGAFAQAILEGPPELAQSAAHAWLAHESALLDAPPPPAPDARLLAKVRIQMHYLRHACFVAPGQLLAGVSHIRHLPGVIVQGLADPVCPPQHAERLHRAWPEATWVPLPGAGHNALTPAIARACIMGLSWVAECAALSGAT